MVLLKYGIKEVHSKVQNSMFGILNNKFNTKCITKD